MIISSLLFCHLLTKPEREREHSRQSKGLLRGDLRMSSLMDDALYSPVHNTVHFYLNSNDAIWGLARACARVCVCEGPAAVDPFCSVYCRQWVWTPLKKQRGAKGQEIARYLSSISFSVPTHTHTHTANYTCYHYRCRALIARRQVAPAINRLTYHEGTVNYSERLLQHQASNVRHYLFYLVLIFKITLYFEKRHFPVISERLQPLARGQWW